MPASSDRGQDPERIVAEDVDGFNDPKAKMISDIFEILRKNFNNDTYGYVDNHTLYVLALEISSSIGQ